MGAPGTVKGPQNKLSISAVYTRTINEVAPPGLLNMVIIDFLSPLYLNVLVLLAGVLLHTKRKNGIEMKKGQSKGMTMDRKKGRPYYENVSWHILLYTMCTRQDLQDYNFHSIF